MGFDFVTTHSHSSGSVGDSAAGSYVSHVSGSLSSYSAAGSYASHVSGSSSASKSSSKKILKSSSDHTYARAPHLTNILQPFSAAPQFFGAELRQIVRKPHEQTVLVVGRQRGWALEGDSLLPEGGEKTPWFRIVAPNEDLTVYLHRRAERGLDANAKGVRADALRVCI